MYNGHFYYCSSLQYAWSVTMSEVMGVGGLMFLVLLVLVLLKLRQGAGCQLTESEGEHCSPARPETRPVEISDMRLPQG